MQDVLLGAQISGVKQPYAYFNKELAQQIDVCDVGLSTVFSPVMYSKPQHPPVSMGPPFYLKASGAYQRGSLLGKRLAPQLGA